MRGSEKGRLYNMDTDDMEEIYGQNLEFHPKVFACIAAGDAEQLRREINDGLSEYLRRIASDLQGAKQMFVFMASLAYYMACSGGLYMHRGRTMYDAFIKRLRQMTSVEEVLEAAESMLLSYAKEVHSQEAAGYSSEVALCVSWIHEHIYETMTANDLYLLVKISPSTLQRHFKTETGQTISRFIRHQKIKKAKYLLRYTTWSLSEISHRLSFCSQSYFIEQFKAETEQCPHSYRGGVGITNG